MRQSHPPSSSSDGELVEYIRAMGGAPNDVLANQAFMRAYYPGMRADLAVYESYRYRADAPLLGCAVTAYAGAGDTKATIAQIDRWRDHSTGPFRLSVLPGDHLFLRSCLPALVGDIARSLTGSAA
jgi:surfactin synthase thioesterase subunit